MNRLRGESLFVFRPHDDGDLVVSSGKTSDDAWERAKVAGLVRSDVGYGFVRVREDEEWRYVSYPSDES